MYRFVRWSHVWMWKCWRFQMFDYKKHKNLVRHTWGVRVSATHEFGFNLALWYSRHYKSNYYTSDMAVTVAIIYCFNTGLEMHCVYRVCVCVCGCVVYGSVKGSAQPRVREMDEGAEPQTLIYICWLSSHQHPATTPVSEHRLEVPSFIMPRPGTEPL